MGRGREVGLSCALRARQAGQVHVSGLMGGSRWDMVICGGCVWLGFGVGS